MVKEVKGNLLDMFERGDFNIIAHGCNCQKVMGAGIAKQIKDRYPYAHSADLYDNRTSLQRLGDFSHTPFCEVFNLYTQYNPGRNLDYIALQLSLKKFRVFLLENFSKKIKIGLPQIGCGIAGGDWDRVKTIIEKELEGMDVTIVYYEA